MKFKPTIDSNRCKNCRLCANFCPHEVITAITDDPLARPEVTNPDKCVGCRICEKFCPDFAIKVEKITPKNEA